MEYLCNICFMHSVDAVIEKYGLTDPALRVLATIVRGADTDARELAEEAWERDAAANGFREIGGDDHENMARPFPVHDACCRALDGT